MYENIIGHEDIKKKLDNSVQNNSISHAYLFYGKKGVGKSTIAKEFAKKILNVDILESSPDYTYITRKEEKKDIIIEQIRKDLIVNIYEAPAASEKKVYIIDDAEFLNIASQNALLKTLEEPPKYVVVILVSSNISAFLPTIISRVKQMNFDGIEEEILKNYINNKFNTCISDNIIKYVDGSIGAASNIIEKNLYEKLQNVEKIYEKIKDKNVVGAMILSQDIKFNEDDMFDYLEYLLYINYNYSCVKFVHKAKNRLKYNGNYDIVLDNMILKIIDNII